MKKNFLLQKSLITLLWRAGRPWHSIALFLSFISIQGLPTNSFCQNVGIGTTVPAFKLDVKTGSINTDSIYRINSFPVLSIAGAGNLFVGRQAGQITTGSFNTFSGNLSGTANTTANFNSFFGAQAGSSNTSGSSNSFFGHIAGALNVTGYSNVAFGKAALFSNDDGHNNVAIGDSALYNQAANVINLAIGSKAGYSNISGTRNAFVGNQSGYSNNTGFDNTFMGDSAGYSNSIGYGNTYLGSLAGYSNLSGDFNTFSGYATGYKNSGGHNSFFGAQAGFNNTVGIQNCFIGEDAGVVNISGNALTMLGSHTNTGATNLTNAAAIGYGATVTCSFCMVLGGTTANGHATRVGINNTTPLTDLHIIQQTDAALDKVRGIRLERSTNTNHWRTLIDPSNNYIFEYNDVLYSYVEPVGGAFVNPSDERLKTGIAPLPGVMDKLLLLQPKTYQYIATKDAGRFSYGFIAQEVEKLFPEFVFTSEDGTKGIAYSNFSVIAIKAIQEQQEIIKRLQIQVEAAKAEIPMQIRKQQIIIERLKIRLEAEKTETQTQADKQQQLIEMLLKKNDELEKRIEALEKR